LINSIKYYLIIFCLLLLVGFSFGQNISVKLDSAAATWDETPALSLEYCKEAEELSLKENVKEYTGRIAHCKARYYILITEFDLANKEINKAIDFYKSENDSSGLIHSFESKAILLRKMGDDKASHALMLHVIKLQYQLKDYAGLTSTLNNVTLFYRGGGDVDSMKMFLDQLLELKDYFSDQDHYYYYQNLGSYYWEIGKYELAAAKYSQGLKVTEDLKMTDARATCLMLMAKTYRLNKQFGIAEIYAKESYDLSVEHKLVFEKLEALQQLVKIYEAQNRMVEAYELYKEEVLVQTEIFDLQKIQKVKQVEAKLQLAEKEKKIALGEAELKAEKLENAEKESRILWMSGIVIVILILLSFTIFIYIKTRRLNATIRSQKKEVEIKSLNLEEALSNIEDSLEYSKMIQNAMLPPLNDFEKQFEESFVYFQPKDIVSGDFYWVHEAPSQFVFAVGDCTGHGVPGAMVSMVCHEALNKVVKEYNRTEPNEILDNVRDIVVNSFNKNQNLNDGMDVALVSIEDNRQLNYAGAHNPIWIYRKGNVSPSSPSDRILVSPFEGNDYSLVEIKADKQPIGRFEKSQPFTLQSFELEKGDSIYLFSDGFADQFGGGKGKKIKTGNFKKLLHSLQDLSMEKQHIEIQKFFDKWKEWPDNDGAITSFEQIDDVCVIGVRI
jgi:serine phosphatase RsbU (regulator of sigma subunit)